MDATVGFCMIQVIKDNWNWSFLSKIIPHCFSITFQCFVLFCFVGLLLLYLCKKLETNVNFIAFYGTKDLGSVFLRQGVRSLYTGRSNVWSSVCSTSARHFNSWQTPCGASAFYYSYFSLRQIECGIWKGSLHTWRFHRSLRDKGIIWGQRFCLFSYGAWYTVIAVRGKCKRH